MDFHTSSKARAFLENLSSKYINENSKVLPQHELERRLEEILVNQGEDKLLELRDQARDIANILSMGKEFSKLDSLIGALLEAKPVYALTGEVGKDRTKDMLYDASAINRLQLLFAEIRNYPFTDLKQEINSTTHFNNKAFFEAYFSNYIEGNTFEIEEAENIIFDKKIPENRAKDAADLLGTFNIVSNLDLMRQVPTSFTDLIATLKTRHQSLMQNHLEVLPGNFKNTPNRADDTHFVRQDYVTGTLIKGFQLYQDLPVGMARAIYVMFLVAEVRPFKEANGRIARIMMNAELQSQNLQTIIIPNVYRGDYIGALRALNRRNQTQPIVKMLTMAQKFSALDFSIYPKIFEELKMRNWFAEPDW
jgi:hypothetical protein